MIKKTILLPDEAKERWKEVKSKAALSGKPIGNWIWDLIKQALQKKS